MLRAEWYVVWVATGKEMELLPKLRQIPGMLQALCPRQALWQRKGGTWTQKEQLIFPGYIFLRCVMNSRVYYAAKALDGMLVLAASFLLMGSAMLLLMWASEH